MRKDIHNSDIPKICQSCEARHRGICGALNSEELTMLSRETHLRSFHAGEELIAEGEDAPMLANVMTGIVKLTKMLSDGRQQVVGLQFAPDLIGRPFVDQSTAYAQAASDVELCRFPRRTLERMFEQNPELERRVLKQTLRELDDARDWMLTLGRKTAAEKVASFLVLIATNIDPAVVDPLEAQKAVTFELTLSRMEIADFLGLTLETVSRQLSKLRKDKVIEITHNRHVHIPNLERLKKRCG